MGSEAPKYTNSMSTSGSMGSRKVISGSMGSMGSMGSR